MNKQKFMVTMGIGLVLYLIATGLSYAGFVYIGKASPSGVTAKPNGSGSQEHFVIDPSAPKIEACPINGVMYTKQEKEIWSGRRPLAVMIENHAEARPQSGLSSADVIYESVVEGGITRFMGVFYCGIAAASVNLAPVRSARQHFLGWVQEYDALYNHVGGAGLCDDPTVDERAKALCNIQKYKIKDMDQFGISFPTCYRNYDRLDHAVATEHTMVCVTDKLISLAKTKGWTNVDAAGVPWDKGFVPWKFKNDAKESERGTSTSISFSAWKGYEREYGVRWDYDKVANVYKRFNGGVPHTDLENKQQLTAKVVAILFAKETGPVDTHAHLLYDNMGSGEGLVFQDGKAIKAVWKKETRTARTKFFDAATNKEIEFTRGQIWIEMLPTGTPVTY
ncbi:DUF3048 domain-containing protein [Candidatus Gottesmanbacteria bacterium]|nr:DUF3048 domain-containing protein [Candidatus Gottesmanbacteria bacterium]